MTSLVAALVAVFALSLTAWAQPAPKLYDDFESGSLTGWTLLGSPAPFVQTGTNAVPAGGTKAVAINTSANRIWKEFTPSPAAQQSNSFRASCWIYDGDPASLNGRGFFEVKSTANNTYSGSYQQILAIGVYNTTTVLTPNTAKYYARVVTGPPGGWFTLNSAPDRSAGWHKFDIERGTNSTGLIILKFYQDGILGAIFTNATPTWTHAYANWCSAEFGLGAGTSVADELVDGIEVVQGQAFIGDEPQSKTNLVGQSVTLSVGASGSAGPISYYWFKDGVQVVNDGRITGADTSDLVISSSQTSDAGYYSVMVSNVWGARTSSVPAYLQISSLVVSQNPSNKIVNLGSNDVSFACSAYGSGTITYQWRKDGIDIQGATDAIYNIPIVTSSDVATNPGYVCFIDNGTHSALTTAATLRSNAPPVLGAVTNTHYDVNKQVVIWPPISDDFSSQGLFQTYETGTATTFSSPGASGSTSPVYVENATAKVYLTNNFSPFPGSGSRVAFMTMNFTNSLLSGFARVITASPNPLLSFAGPVRFNIRTDRPMGVNISIRETFGKGTIEWAGSAQGGTPPLPIYSTTPNTWTNFQFDIWDVNGWAYNYVQPSGLITGDDGILDGGKGTWDAVCLTPQDGLGVYNVWVDNLQSIGDNPLTMSLVSGPSGAVMDPYTGVITWTTPPSYGNHDFTIAATDHLGLVTTKTFTIQVAPPAPKPEPLTYHVVNGQLVLSWTNTVWTLEAATDIAGGFTPIIGATSPYTNSLSGQKFFRLHWAP